MEQKTHSSLVYRADDGRGLNDWRMNETRRQSLNFRVVDSPISVLIWGLAQGEIVEVRRAQVAALGHVNWQQADESCGCAISPPSEVGNVAHMAYSRCGVPVVLTAENPHAVIDDVGAFFLVYRGSGEVVAEVMRDVVQRKHCCTGLIKGNDDGYENAQNAEDVSRDSCGEC